MAVPAQETCRFVVYGSGRLAVAVARAFRRRHEQATVAVIGDAETLRHLEGDGVEPHREDVDLAVSLRAAELRDADCLLALNDRDEDNIRAATVARVVSPATPVVLHTFDPLFADLLERGGRGIAIDLNIRRAYSMAALAAPFFVALALEERNLVTMRFGDTEIPISSLVVGGPRSPLAATPGEVRALHDCEVVAVRTGSDPRWHVARDDEAIEPGSHVVVGGLQSRLFRLAYANSMERTHADLREALADWLRHERDRAAMVFRVVIPTGRTALLLVLLLLGVAVASLLGHSSDPLEWPYRFVRTALGEQSFDDPPTWWLRALGTLLLVLGAIVLALVLARVTTETTARKLMESVRAQQLRGHVIIAGVGELGYRISALLKDAGIRYAAIDPDPEDRFIAAVRRDGPVIAGDIRLQENLENAGVRRACAVIACSRDNLANVEVCMRAEELERRRHEEATALGPIATTASALRTGTAAADRRLQTVARVFDDQLAEQAAHALGISRTLAAVEVAAPAFVDAAVHAWARREFAAPLEDGEPAPPGGDRRMLGYRVVLARRPTDDELRRFRAEDRVRFLAFRELDGATTEALPSSVALDAAAGPIGVVVAGWRDDVERFVARVRATHEALPDGGDGLSAPAPATVA